MLRREFLKRMAWVTAGIGMLGTELAARVPEMKPTTTPVTFTLNSGDTWTVSGYALISGESGELLYWEYV